MSNTLEEFLVTVYNDDDPLYDSEDYSGFSFNAEDKSKMTYSKTFLPFMSTKAVGVTLRDSSAKLNELLLEDIVFPEFYHDIGSFIGMQFTQG